MDDGVAPYTKSLMLPHLFEGMLLGSLLLYAFLIGRFLLAWRKLPEQHLPAGFRPGAFISVIVPVRNEVQHISLLLADFTALQYPSHLFEVIVVDDHSGDGTGERVQAYALNSPYTLHYVDLKDYPARKLKKGAIQQGIALARGELIVCTDGDCRVQPEWLSMIAYVFAIHPVRFVSGPVCFHPTDTLFAKIQMVEFAALIGVGAGSIAMGYPNMCNGANVAYRKSSFEEVGGFAGNEQVASGDDEFLMHKMHWAWPGQVYFLKARGAVVYTGTQPTVRAFLEQRVRWASKWRHYQRRDIQLTAFFIFWVNLLLFIGMGLAVSGNIAPVAYTLCFIIKLGTDFVFLNNILRFFGQSRLLPWVLPLQLVYIPYVVLTALASLFGGYRWKGRDIYS